jgi:hypothetical protein
MGWGLIWEDLTALCLATAFVDEAGTLLNLQM